jgi:hypothetical protein
MKILYDFGQTSNRLTSQKNEICIRLWTKGFGGVWLPCIAQIVLVMFDWLRKEL